MMLVSHVFFCTDPENLWNRQHKEQHGSQVQVLRRANALLSGLHGEEQLTILTGGDFDWEAVRKAS